MRTTATMHQPSSGETERKRVQRVRRVSAVLAAELSRERLDRRRVRRLAFELQGHRDAMWRHLTRRLRMSAGDDAARVARELLTRPRGESERAWAHARACHVEQTAAQARQIGGLINRAQYALEHSSLTRRVLRTLWQNQLVEGRH